jgi:hypothetical protein
MISIALGLLGKHWEKIVAVFLVAAVVGYIYVTGRKHERQLWRPKYEAVVEASKTAAAQAEAERASQSKQAAESQERIVAHYQERVHQGNAALQSALGRLRLSASGRPLQPASTAPAPCRDYEASPDRLSMSDREISLRLGAGAREVTDRLAAVQQLASDLHSICSVKKE